MNCVHFVISLAILSIIFDLLFLILLACFLSMLLGLDSKSFKTHHADAVLLMFCKCLIVSLQICISYEFWVEHERIRYCGKNSDTN